MLVAAACVGFNNPEGWAGPTAAADDLLVVSTDKGELSALDLAPETGSQCDNSTDDDEDGWVNEGCPRDGAKAERGRDCANSTSDDAVDDIPDDDKINDGCPAAVPLWTFPTGQEEPEIDLEAIYTTPLVIDDTVYLGGYNGDVYALNLDDGSVLWSFDADGPIIAGLAAGETAVYVATDKGIVYALSLEDGSERQRFDAGSGVWGTPLLAEGVVYVASVNGELYALDAETLDTIWDAPFKAERGLISDPVLADGAILIGGFDRELHAVNVKTGEEREGWPLKADNWFWGRPLVLDGTVYAPNLDGNLYALSLESGAPVWDAPIVALEPLRSAPLLVGDALVLVDRKGNIYGLDPKTGKELWSKTEEDGIEKTVLSNPQLLTETDDDGQDVERVYISAQGGDLFRIDPEDGSF
ncbi:MAG: PQQ-binding-like beta-propeller repeat protein, partial [Chloroflexi bacterium]|nr:PQQ-binding-like beta-propeller repeat protein [Chloroflexota bacterium]